MEFGRFLVLLCLRSFFVFSFLCVVSVCLGSSGCRMVGVCGGYDNSVYYIIMCLLLVYGYIYYNKVITYYFIMGVVFVVVPVCYSCNLPFASVNFLFGLLFGFGARTII